MKLAFFLSNEKQESTLFIFDEPTTGLHFHDINTLLKSFNQLIERGHTVVIIEHNMDIIKCADHVIDMGPEGGKEGGYVVCTGTPEEIAECSASYTGMFLKEKLRSCFKFIEKKYYHCKQVCSGHIAPLFRILNPLIFVNSPLLTKISDSNLLQHRSQSVSE